MNRFRSLIAASALVLCAQQAGAAALKDAYIDDTGTVHVVTAAGKDLSVARGASTGSAKLAPDGDSAAWLVTAAAPAPPWADIAG